ncbi:hypothetical protein [Enterobacter ludwigii]|uniref:hypothetical protein n=1 Tax=Enterobacter ludwigii TaxID=299767 RepID=UPI0039766583
MEIYFDAQFDDLLTELVDEDKVFPTYMHFACFAASIGWRLDNVQIKTRGKSARDTVFTNNQTEGLIYLIGINKTNSMECLREENINQCWDHFQSAVNAGMNVINDWLHEFPLKDKSEVILLHMLSAAIEISNEQSTNNGVDINNIGDLLL